MVIVVQNAAIDRHGADIRPLRLRDERNQLPIVWQCGIIPILGAVGLSMVKFTRSSAAVAVPVKCPFSMNYLS
jgi:hypothetical protein